jgi:hypothetical protein
MTQAALPYRPREPGPRSPGLDLGPDVEPGTKEDDLYLYTLPGVTLAKGERMAMTIADFTVEYRDVYTLHMPIAPPPEARQRFDSQQQREIALLLNRPKVIHSARITNTGSQPLTTAPAMIFRNGRLVAQNLMTYTPAGGTGDLPITTAVNVLSDRREVETGRSSERKPDGNYSRVDLQGNITLANRDEKKLEVEVHRYTLGHADSAGQDGASHQINLTDYESHWPLHLDHRGRWWTWYNWPWWWHHVNGVALFEWTVTLEPGQTTDLDYTWHYYWKH